MPHRRPKDAEDLGYDPGIFEEIRSALSAVLAEHDENRIKRVKLSQASARAG